MDADHGLSIRDLLVRIGAFELRVAELTIRSGEYFVLTGPNGAGKSVLIRTIAGLQEPVSGSILLEGQPIHTAPPWRRGVGYVPQEGVLFPNRTVRGNISFPLEVRNVTRDEMERRVPWIADLVGVTHLLERRVDGLSGGERQKVCLARALVFRPRLLLLDEPVSAIDEEARDPICRELRSLQRETGVTTLHVSHSRHESQLVGDRIGVLRAGRLEGIEDVRRHETS